MTVLRRLGWALVALGVIGAVLYPIWFKTYHNIDLGTYRIYDRQGGFRTIADVSLSPAAAPLLIRFTGRGQMPAQAEAKEAATDFTLVLRDDHADVATRTIRLTGSDLSGDVVPGGLVGVAKELSLIEALGEGRYAFSFRAGAADGVDLAFLDMGLSAHVAEPGPWVQNLSLVLLGAGFAIVIIARFGARRARPGKPASQSSVAGASSEH